MVHSQSSLSSSRPNSNVADKCSWLGPTGWNSRKTLPWFSLIGLIHTKHNEEFLQITFPTSQTSHWLENVKFSDIPQSIRNMHNFESLKKKRRPIFRLTLYNQQNIQQVSCYLNIVLLTFLHPMEAQVRMTVLDSLNLRWQPKYEIHKQSFILVRLDKRSSTHKFRKSTLTIISRLRCM